MAVQDKKKRGRGIPDKRGAILQAAVRLFARHGFESTTTKMIAREAGVAEGTIYLYFPTKKHILLAFIEPMALETLKDILERMKGVSDEEILYAVLFSRIRLWQTHRDLIRAVFPQVFFDRDLAESFAGRVIRPAMELLESYLARRIQEGAFRDIDPHIAAQALIGQAFATILFFGPLLGGLGAEIAPEQLASNLTRLFLEGMRR